MVERNLLPALLPLAAAAGIGFAVDRARRLGLLLALVLCAYWIAFDVHVTQTPNLQRPDFRALTEELGPRGPRAIVTWKLAADPVRFYLPTKPLRIYSGDTPMREIDVISKSAVGYPEGVPPKFHPVARIRFERLTLTRILRPAAFAKFPSTSLRDVRTGFGVNAVVVDGPRGAADERGSEFAYRLGAAARRPASWWQLLKFGLVGGSGYLINLAVFALLSGTRPPLHSAAIGAFCVAVCSNFFWNRHWTFAAGDGHAGFQAARFFTVSVAALLINLAVLEALVGGDFARRPLRAGDRGRGRDALQLPRQQALDLRLAPHSAVLSSRRPSHSIISGTRRWRSCGDGDASSIRASWIAAPIFSAAWVGSPPRSFSSARQRLPVCSAVARAPRGRPPG